MQNNTQDHLIDYLLACANGEAKGIERLYRATSARLYAQLLRIVRDEGAAQDCLQQVYLRVWQTAGRFDASQAKPMTCLGTIARNIGIDWLRRRHRQVEEGGEALDALAAHDDMVAAVDLAHSTQRLHECLEALSGNQRRALERAYFEGLTHGELASALAQPLGTIKSWIRRGLERLKVCMSSGT